jgi:site-specific DNA-methyltransferase (adenine-specific)
MIPPKKRRHPTEKPVGLLEALIRFSTKVGETVLDLFAGSCSTGRAALNLGRNAICIERSEDLLAAAVSSIPV